MATPRPVLRVRMCQSNQLVEFCDCLHSSFGDDLPMFFSSEYCTHDAEPILSNFWEEQTLVLGDPSQMLRF